MAKKTAPVSLWLGAVWALTLTGMPWSVTAGADDPGALSAVKAGAKADGTTDDTAAIKKTPWPCSSWATPRRCVV